MASSGEVASRRTRNTPIAKSVPTQRDGQIAWASGFMDSHSVAKRTDSAMANGSALPKFLS